MDIDFVMAWVDGSDPAWLKKKAEYKGTNWQEDAARYRDWDILRYWFRAVEQYAPWVHHIFFVTDNQRPKWLNTDNPKLTVVDHREFMPEKYLPNFNSNCIEAFIHKIPGLSDYFVAFNDDMYINQPIKPEYYFRDGMPCCGTYEHAFGGRGYFKNIDGWGINVTDYMNTQVLNAHFNRMEVTTANKHGWYGAYLDLKYRLQAYMIKMFRRTEFQHFYTPHNEKAFLKSTFEEVWEAEPELMASTCSRFREITNLNIYLMRMWQLAKNKFFPTDELSTKKVIQLNSGCLPELEHLMFDKSVKSLCVNDSSNCSMEEYLELKPLVKQLFEKKLPERSTFETSA